MTNTSLWSAEEAGHIIDEHLHLDGALLPVLHKLQLHFGYIDDEAIALIAGKMNLSPAEIQGVISFYHDFKTSPPTKTLVRVCMAESCRVTGAKQVMQELTALPDYQAEEVFCLGNCGLSPAAMVDGTLIGRLDQGDIKNRLQEHSQ